MPQLILLRHGESAWNLQNRFTGWVDVSLSEHGMAEAATAGKILRDWRFDVVFTSALLRAQDTAYEVLKHNRHCRHYIRIHETGSPRYSLYDKKAEDEGELVVHVSEALNERYYGDLQGLNKDEARARFGAEQVQQWRRGYRVQPPGGESLEMTSQRVMDYYHRVIEPCLRAGNTLLVPAHGNSLRALIMHLEDMTPDQIMAYELKTGTPHIYDFDAQLNLTGKIIMDKSETAAVSTTQTKPEGAAHGA
ncbi:histidine phosphatase family protein [Acidithiobacillus sp.]|uniref:histidine phosphatase family protein n=1 Tax=Acidithiobacillus sp. TaxID=1872118 RepID=UPI0025BC0F74|nr:histidine phosphatase family protein [Acidithiobacillus sp.]